jgi:hypothetical protein
VATAVGALADAPAGSADQELELFVNRAWFGAASAVTTDGQSVWAGVGGRLVSWPAGREPPATPDKSVSPPLPGRINDLVATPFGAAAAIGGTGVVISDDILGEPLPLVEVAGGAARLSWLDGHELLLVITESGSAQALQPGEAFTQSWRYEPPQGRGIVVDACYGETISVLALQRQEGAGYRNVLSAFRISDSGLHEFGEALAYDAVGDGIAVECRSDSAIAVVGNAVVEFAPGDDGGLRQMAHTRLSVGSGPIVVTDLALFPSGYAISFSETLTHRGGVCILDEDRGTGCWSFSAEVEAVTADDHVLAAVGGLGVHRIEQSPRGTLAVVEVFDDAGVAASMAEDSDGLTVALGQAGVARFEDLQDQPTIAQLRLTDPLIAGFVSVREAFMLHLPNQMPVTPREVVALGAQSEIHMTSVYSASLPAQTEVASTQGHKLFDIYGSTNSVLRENDLFMGVRFGDDGLHRRTLNANVGADELLAPGPVYCMTVTHEGVVFAQGRNVLLYDFHDGATRELFSLNESLVTEIAASDDASEVVIADYGGSVRWFERNEDGLYPQVAEFAVGGQVSSLTYIDVGQPSVLVAFPLGADGSPLAQRGLLDLGRGVSATSGVRQLVLLGASLSSSGPLLHLPGTVMKTVCIGAGCEDVWVAAADGGIIQLKWRETAGTPTPSPPPDDARTLFLPAVRG